MKKRTAIIILVCAVILTAIIQEGLHMVVNYTTPVLVLSSIAIWYSILWLLIDVYHSVRGMAYNRKKLVKDIIFITIDLIVIVTWNYARAYTTSWILDVTVGILFVVLTIINMFDAD